MLHGIRFRLVSFAFLNTHPSKVFFFFYLYFYWIKKVCNAKANVNTDAVLSV